MITDMQIDELRRMIEELERSTAQGLNAYFPLNIAFHDRIVEMAANVTLLQMYRQVVDRMHLLRRRGFERAGGSGASHAEHRVIVDALASRDPLKAAEAMRGHVTGGFDRTFGAGREAHNP